MLNFRYVLNASTGERYYLAAARLEEPDGYDEDAESGNAFTLELQPTDSNGTAHLDVNLYMMNAGGIQIAENLKASEEFPKEYNESAGCEMVRIETVNAYIIEDTLVFAGSNS